MKKSSKKILKHPSVKEEKEYRADLKKLEALMAFDPEPGSPRGMKLAELADKIEAYEKIHYPTPWYTKLKYGARAKLKEWWFVLFNS